MTAISGLHLILDSLRKEPTETEWLEFKENRYNPQELGEYLSALSNSACFYWKSKGKIENRGSRKYPSWVIKDHD